MKKRPSVYTSDTGGIGIDARELFTTDAGREAIEKLVGIDFRKNTQQVGEPEEAEAELVPAVPRRQLVR